jgi:hypothetical protein
MSARARFLSRPDVGRALKSYPESLQRIESIAPAQTSRRSQPRSTRMHTHTRVIAILIPLAAGCLAQSHEGLVPLGDAPPEGPWSECFASIPDGATNDACSPTWSCGLPRSEPGFYDTSVCLDGLLLRQRPQAVYTDECLGAPDEEYVGLDEDGCAIREHCALDPTGHPVTHSRRHICPGEIARRATAAVEPWPLYDNDDCAAMFAGRGRAGDPCVGEGVCFADWELSRGPIIDKHVQQLVAWCRDGEAVVVLDEWLSDVPVSER